MKTLALRLLAALVSGLFWMLLLGAGGAAAISIGVGISFGPGFGLIAAGGLAIAYAALIWKGLTNG